MSASESLNFNLQASLSIKNLRFLFSQVRALCACQCTQSLCPRGFPVLLVCPVLPELLPLIKFLSFCHRQSIINLSMTNLESFKHSAILFPVALLGILIGYKLLKIIEEKLFYNFIYALIFVTSSKLLYDYLI